MKIQRLCVQIQTNILKHQSNKVAKIRNRYNQVPHPTQDTNPKLNMFKNSLSYSGTFIWNSIPVEIRNVNTIDDFAKNG